LPNWNETDLRIAAERKVIEILHIREVLKPFGFRARRATTQKSIRKKVSEAIEEVKGK
jgi:hypothetical protein